MNNIIGETNSTNFSIVGVFSRVDFTDEQRPHRDTTERIRVRDIELDEVSFDNLTPEQREAVCTWLGLDVKWAIRVSCTDLKTITISVEIV